MNSEKIAIILVNYNGINDTIDCIESIHKSNNKNYKIIVVDNASKDMQAQKIMEKYEDVKVIESKINLGFSGGNNLGIDYAIANDYKYILLLNNDTIIDENMIDYLLEYSDSNIITVPKMYYYDNPKSIWYAGGKINKFTGNAEHIHMNKLDNEKDKVQECTFATGCCIMLNVDIIKKIGKLSEEYFMYCEDTDYCLKALTNGIKILYIPKAKLWHKVSKSTGGEISPFSIYYMTRNRFMYIKKYRKYFFITAYYYTLFTRFIRILQFRLINKPQWKSIKKGITDYKKNIIGKIEKFF